MLVQPSHPGNVGACARAMRVMGLHDLCLVSPRVPEAPRHPDAVAFASGATDVLERCRIVDSLEAALAQVTLVVGVSAETREFGPTPEPPEEAAARVLMELDADSRHRVALVFGPERTGLSIQDVARCQALCSIPGDTEYSSLNLAQAVQVLAYVLRRAADARSASPAPAETARWASQAEITAFFAHFERALIAIRFLDPAHPKKLMARMRRLFGRTRLESEEVQLLRGVCKQAELAARGELPSRHD
ncbi:MAG: tRNA/rRNA methyltransferase [Pseudomonadota bacterium]